MGFTTTTMRMKTRVGLGSHIRFVSLSYSTMNRESIYVIETSLVMGQSNASHQERDEDRILTIV